MKEKISLKRQSRRCKSESSSKDHSCSSQNEKLMKDGKEICPIPLVDCLCPDQAVNRGNPEESVKMLCSNRSCSFSSNAYVHMECFKALEEKMYIVLKHLGHKTSNWTDTQIRQNLWDRKGLTLIQAQIRCPCNGGISLRDEEAWIRRENGTQKADKKRKAKKKNLPSIITRVRCESESAPPQYDSHSPESDDCLEPDVASQFLKCRLGDGHSKPKRASKKALTPPFKLEKLPEIEFPAIGVPRRPASLSFCESDVKKERSLPYTGEKQQDESEPMKPSLMEKFYNLFYD